MVRLNLTMQISVRIKNKTRGEIVILPNKSKYKNAEEIQNRKFISRKYWSNHFAVHVPTFIQLDSF